jgi:hypothetical protein
MSINDYMMKNREERESGFFMTPKVVCADGFTMSVQASRFHYCSPRNDEGPYAAFEVGFPSEKCEELMPYAESADNPTGTVYGWVPAEVVDEVIRNHGGIVVNLISGASV